MNEEAYRTRLQARRLSLGLSQSQLAEKCPEVKLRTLQRYEQGVLNINKASVTTLLALARALDCKPEDIIESEK